MRKFICGKISELLRFMVYLLLPITGGGWMGVSCSDLIETDSELVEFQKDNRLQSPSDTVYSVMGIVYKMQAIADRTVLLGELRGDLVSATASATTDLKAIANFEVDTDNAYNRISDYYAIINNCNYFLAYVNKDLVRHDRTVFEHEYAAVKAFRAWTYLQLAQIYGSVPLVTEPLLSEEASQVAMQQPPQDIKAICKYFIDDLKPYADTKLPTYGTIDYKDSKKFFIPVRALLGDLCLWAGRYSEAAQYYHDYLSQRTAPIRTNTSSARWADANTRNFMNINNTLSYDIDDTDCLTLIPMESGEFYGVKSQLYDIFNSTDLNQQYAKVKPTKRMYQLSAKYNYCYKEIDSKGGVDTLYAERENLTDSMYVGDLRFSSVYEHRITGEDRYSRISNETQRIRKYYSSSAGVTLYRANMVYLRYAEALNRAGYPQSAFAVLKYGLYRDVVSTMIDDVERTDAAALITFDPLYFSIDNTQGVHARGCGDADCDTTYCMPMPKTAEATRQDTINYQIPEVEDMIIDEMALEGAFEGYRYYDLMRVALRRGKASYLADAVSLRHGKVDAELRTKLMDQKNWYLPKP